MAALVMAIRPAGISLRVRRHRADIMTVNASVITKDVAVAGLHSLPCKFEQADPFAGCRAAFKKQPAVHRTSECLSRTPASESVKKRQFGPRTQSRSALSIMCQPKL